MCKKKGIILMLIPFFAFMICTSKVEAKADPTSACVAKIQMPSVRTIAFSATKQGRIHTIRRMKLGEATGLCLDPGKAMNNGTLLMVGRCNDAVIAPRVKKAINYCEKRACATNDVNYTMAQVYAWGYGTLYSMQWALCSYMEKSIGIGPGEASVYSKLGNGLIVMNENVCGDVGQGDYGKRAAAILKDIDKTGTDGEFVCSSNGNPDYQRVITKKKKITCVSGDIEPGKILCPEGTKNAGLDLTHYINDLKMSWADAVQKYCGDEQAACTGYQWNLSGNLSACQDNNSTTTSTFREVVGAASADYSGDKKAGKKLDVNIGSGAYCAVYCKETEAKAVLPGGIATPIARGSALTWPTSTYTSTSRWGNMFPLEYSGKKECKVLVAPNLTYGNSCNLEPLKMYEEYLADMKKYYNQGQSYNYSNLRNTATQANKYLEKHDGTLGVNFRANEIKTISNLTFKNEKIREYDGQTTYLNVFESYNIDNGKFFGAPYYYKKYGDDNYSKANDSYDAAWRKYCDLHKTYPADSYQHCEGQIGYDEHGNQTCSDGWKTKYSCPDGGSLTNNNECTCTETRAKKMSETVRWLDTARSKWNYYRSAITNRYTIYKNYIKAYQNATGLYHEIKLCSNFGTGATDADGGTTFSCGGQSCDFYNFLTSATMEYTDEGPEYGSTHELVMEIPTSYSCDGCESNVAGMVVTNQLLGAAETGYRNIQNTYNVSYMGKKIDAIEKRTMHLSATATTYSLPPGLYNYIDKDKNKFVMQKPGGNFQTLGLTENYGFEYSNLPTSYNNIPGKKYNLIIKNIMLGDNGHFQAGAEGVSFNDYICHYEVTADYDDCLCPPGTKWEDVDLYQALLDSNGSLTCADAKIKYCNMDNIPKCEVNCVLDKYCSNDPTIKITACVNSGKSKGECEALLCGLGKFTCDNNTLRKGMDITSCVQTRIAQGSSQSEAVKYCNATICTLQNIFIYRTIDLRDPFPSVDADASISQKISHRKFNLNVKGRYPGTNWNSEELVKTVILNNRGASNYDIYKQKPLYHIELNTSRIMDIRAYNEKQAKHDNGYNDYTLSCVQDTENSRLGTSCYSSFVHNPKYGFDTSGNKSTCGSAGTTTSLGKCLYN